MSVFKKLQVDPTDFESRVDKSRKSADIQEAVRQIRQEAEGSRPFTAMVGDVEFGTDDQTVKIQLLFDTETAAADPIETLELNGRAVRVIDQSPIFDGEGGCTLVLDSEALAELRNARFFTVDGKLASGQAFNGWKSRV